MADQQRAIDIVDGVVVGVESTRDCIAGRNCIGVAVHGGRRHRAGAGQGDSANGFTGHQTYRGESRCAQDQRVAEYLGGIVGRNCAVDVWLTIANPAKPRQNELNPIRKELESFIKHPFEFNLKFQLVDRVSKNYINVLSIGNS